MMQKRCKYITFAEVEREGRKTKIFAIINNLSGAVLGNIIWYGPWRQYCFFPAGDHVVFNKGCLEDICGFITCLMDERKRMKN
ncbi:MAG: hypothetical protein LBQ21_07545 [Clostridiales Family XIII bacterium]|jgi:hypothetical protein|nr:hypothetical protein [Clostridiales Family XIII bacterium]